MCVFVDWIFPDANKIHFKSKLLLSNILGTLARLSETVIIFVSLCDFGGVCFICVGGRRVSSTLVAV